MTDEALIAEVRAWIAANPAPTGEAGHSDFQRSTSAVIAWRRKVHAAGYAVPSWPPHFGGLGITAEQSRLVEREFKSAGLPGSGVDRLNIPANILMRFGSDAARAELLDPFVTGAFSFCLLYSEPGAGSDLAGVRTRADRKGDQYVITGQKVWTSSAADADYGLLLCRTDWDKPKHAGLSFMLCPMKQDGIEIRPIHQITGERHFNEVFIDQARVPARNLLANEGDGWKVMQSALGYERLIMSEGVTDRRDGADGGLMLVALAKANDRIEDPVVRQQIAEVVAWRRLNELTATRAKAAGSGEGAALMSLSKLAMSRVLHGDARVRRNILGARSLLDGPGAPDARELNYHALFSYINSIGGGTDQIQRNIIGERILGLPREVETDRTIPFRQSLSVTGAEG
jgi:alkylation response protein AidB-like acyl-CoA dehydrogenase